MIKPVDLINCISVFQLAFFTFYIFKKGTRTKSNLLLGIFFIAQFLVLGNDASLNIFGLYERFKITTSLLTVPIYFLWGPLMYFYIISQVKHVFVLKPVHLIHVVPFLAVLVYFTFTYYGLDFNSKMYQLNHGILSWKLNVINLMVNIQVLSYNSVSLFTLIIYQHELKHISSSVKNQNLGWLKTVLFGYILACIVTETLFFMGNKIQLPNEMKEFIVFSSFLVFFNVLFYKAMINPHVFIGIDKKIIQNEGCVKDDFINQIKTLETFMKENRPYLNPSLTLKELSNSTQLGERVISQIINQHYQKNFYTYINSFRIEEAKKLILSNNLDKITMLGIAFDAGFNSKSVFYDTFKKYVGMTPTQYRQICA